MSLYPLDVPTELLEEIRQLARTDQLSLDEWFLDAIALKVEAEKTHQ